MVEIYVKKVRQAKRMSLRDLAAESGVAKSYLEKIESGAANPSVEVMCKLGEALDVPICELFRCNYDSRRDIL